MDTSTFKRNRIGFFEAGYLHKRGYLYLVVNAVIDPDLGLHAEYSVIVQELPSQKFELLAARKMKVALDTDAVNEIPIDDPILFAFDQSKSFANGQLMTLQWEIYQREKQDHILREITLVEGDWKQELLRLRYRGMDHDLLDQLATLTVNRELAQYFRWLQTKQPIVVRDVMMRLQ